MPSQRPPKLIPSIKHRPLHLLIVLSALFASNFEKAISAEPETHTDLSSGTCRVKPLKTWSSQEQWVWIQICEGKVADFNTTPGYGGQLDPKKPEGWSKKRALRSQFLRTILLHEQFRGALPESGVRIIGAWFQEPIDLYNATLTHHLALGGCRFEEKVRFDVVKITNHLVLNRSKFNAPLSMAALKISGVLEMRDGEFSEVDLRSAQIGHHLHLSGSNFTGILNLNAAHISGSLQMEHVTVVQGNFVTAKIDDQVQMSNSRFKGLLEMGAMQAGSSVVVENIFFTDIDMRNATIGQSLSLNRVTISGMLTLQGIRLGGDLLVAKSVIAKVNLRQAKIDNGVWIENSSLEEAEFNSAMVGGELALANSKLLRCLIMENVKVGNSLSLRGLQVAVGIRPIQIIYAEIASSLFLDDGTLGSLDLSGTKIRGALILGWKDHPSLKWHSNSRLTLRNAEVGAIQDVVNVGPNKADVWPDKLELIGFTYAHLGGIGIEETDDDPANREADWYISWLARQVNYSPQPYEQLAGVLQKAGHSDKAQEILYAGRNRGLGRATGLEFVWLLLLKFIIGFGYRIYYALGWAAGLVCIGAFVLHRTGEGPRHRMPYGLSYSLDMLLPIVDLREHHKGINLSGVAKYYFYFHKIMGFILVSFILAGLAGLTKLSS